MNLIEQLGGYKKAKIVCDCVNGPLGLIAAGHSHYTKAMVSDALLEYRRQHNIFEIGDLVTYKAHFKGMWREGFGKITEIDEDLEAVNIDENVGVAISEIDHASPKEIEAGKRLEVNDGST